MKRSALTKVSTWYSVVNPESPRGGGGNPPAGVGTPTYDFAKFPKNCMKLKEFGPKGGVRPKFYYVDPSLIFASFHKIYVTLFRQLV